MNYCKLKRFTAGLLATLLLIGYPAASVVSFAAEQYYIKFEAEDSATATILEGGIVNTKTLKPPGHDFDKATPFAIQLQDGTDADKTLFNIAGELGYYTISALAGSAYGKPGAAAADPRKANSTTYTMNSQLTALLSQGEGNIRIPPIKDPSGTDIPARFYSASVTNTGTIGITTSSTISFTADSDEKVDSSGSSTITLSDIQSDKATGNFSNLAGKQMILKELITKSGNSRKMKISTSGGTPTVANQYFELTINMPAADIITQGTVFSISYNLQPINPLILSVITPKWAVEDVSRSILANPTNPAVTDKNKTPFVHLGKGDTLTSITTNFEVLSQLQKYNAAIEVVWTWESEGNTAQEVVAFGAAGRRTQSVNLVPRKEDVKGHLVATAVYTLAKPWTAPDGTVVAEVRSAEARVPITILGTGNPPTLVPLTQTIGTKPEESIAGNKYPPATMDVYPGGAVGINPIHPHQFTANMVFGQGRGHAEKLIISASGMTKDAVALYVDNSPAAYEMGSELLNTDKVAGNKHLRVVAKKRGQVTLTFDYYIRNSAGQLVKMDEPIRHTIVVDDTTPRDIAIFSNILLQSNQLLPGSGNPPEVATVYPGGHIGFGFQSDTFVYNTIELPSLVTQLNVTPLIPANNGVNPLVGYSVSGEPFANSTGTLNMATSVEADRMIQNIPMAVESPRTITFSVRSEGGREQLYILNINRMPLDRDSTLKSLAVTNVEGVAILQGFSPTQKEYTATVPYKTRWAKVVPVCNSIWSSYAFLNPMGAGPIPGDTTPTWTRLTYPGDRLDNGAFHGSSATTEVRIKVQAQAIGDLFSTTYRVQLTRQAPSTNNLIGSATLKDGKDRELSFDEGAKFDKNTKIYYLHIPYSATKLQLSLTPDDKVAQSVTLTPPGAQAVTLPYPGDGVGLRFQLDTPVKGATEKDFELRFTALAENDTLTDPPYIIKVTRNDPEQDDTLVALELRDQADAIIPTFSFNPQTTDYKVPVSFNTELVRVLPKPRSALARAVVNGVEIGARQPSVTVSLKPGETKAVKVEIFPEDLKAPPRVYNLTLTREQASTDARLKSLTVGGGGTFTPAFIPATTQYHVTIPEGTKGITFTAIPVNPGSTMTLNGVVLQSGTASQPYEPPDAQSKVLLEVTAQDGKAKMIYTLNVTNQNLLPKSKDATLYSLAVNFGSISPAFKPNITEYEVAVKDDVTSVDIVPEASDRRATLKVSSESKELGDYYGEYSAAIRDGENLFTVEVVAEDGKTKKDYEITVYRKDEEKQGSYKPITAELVDFTMNPIVVDISRYTVVAADVFNTLKEKYPDKTIVFQGNDYSLQITGKDIAQLVPHAAIYDLGLTFASPNEEAIWDKMDELDSRNDLVEPVFIHFNHHGALPAPMLFTISLGRAYRTQSATWNYYNEERQRIDFYGGVRTNSRGTFTVPVTHFSTYIYSERRILGAENKSGELANLGSITGGSGNSKPNPNTGLDAAAGRLEE